MNFVIAGEGLGAGYEVLGVALELLALDQRQPGQVASGLEVGGPEPEPAHRLPVVGDVLVCVGDGGAELAALGTLDRRRRAEREPPLQRCDRSESGGFDCSARDRCPATRTLQIDLPVVHRASRDWLPERGDDTSLKDAYESDRSCTSRSRDSSSAVKASTSAAARRLIDAEVLGQPVDQLITRCAFREGRPEDLPSTVDRQVAGLAQIERDELSLDLAPVEVRVPKSQANLRPHCMRAGERERQWRPQPLPCFRLSVRQCVRLDSASG